MTKMASTISWCILAMAAIIIIVCTYWLVYPYNVMDFKVANVINSPVKKGGTLEIQIDAVKHMNLPAKVLGQIENNYAYPFVASSSNAPVGRSKWVLTIPMPPAIHPGTYMFRRTYLYKVNPLREIKVEWSVPFEVR